MLIITATIVRRAKRINSDIQIIDVPSDNSADWSTTGSSGDESADTVLVTVTVVVVVSVTAQVPVRVKCCIR